MKERRSCQKLSLKSGMDPSQSVKCKIVVVGDSQCGKTALLHVFAKDCFPEVRPRTAPLAELVTRVDAHKDEPWCFSWKRMGEMGDWGRTMLVNMMRGWNGERCDSNRALQLETNKPDCEGWSTFSPIWCFMCVFPAELRPHCVWELHRQFWDWHSEDWAQLVGHLR